MDDSPLLNDPGRAWAPYEPSSDSPWDLARVAHLHRRAGFSAPWSVLQRDLKDGPGPSIDRLLDGEPRGGDGLSASEHSELMDAMASRVAASGNLARLQGAWLYRMVFTPHPLRERMTLFWHDHFATSNAKVASTLLMQRQNDALRALALGSFPEMLAMISRDPAMLKWLDCTANRKAHPNENYAREVMELFTLGRGHYTEKDVQEAARAFTGSFVQNDQFRAVPSQHDDGEKTILGRTGRFSGTDVEAILLDQPACAEYLCGKLFESFVNGVRAPTRVLVAPLAEAFRRSNYDIKAPVEMILRSSIFHDSATRRTLVKSPVEFVVGTIRALEILRPTASADAMSDATSKMGQALFVPPSVAGWEGGPSWVNTTTTLARSNFALGLLGKDGGLGGRFDAKALLAKYRMRDEARFYVELLVQDAFDDKVRRRITGDAATLVLTAPEYQLG